MGGGKRTFTIPGPWPLVRLVSGVVNELLWGGGQKNVHRPWPLAPLFLQLAFLLAPWSMDAFAYLFIIAAKPSTSLGSCEFQFQSGQAPMSWVVSRFQVL